MKMRRSHSLPCRLDALNAIHTQQKLSRRMCLWSHLATASLFVILQPRSASRTNEQFNSYDENSLSMPQQYILHNSLPSSTSMESGKMCRWVCTLTSDQSQILPFHACRGRPLPEIKNADIQKWIYKFPEWIFQPILTEVFSLWPGIQTNAHSQFVNNPVVKLSVKQNTFEFHSIYIVINICEMLRDTMWMAAAKIEGTKIVHRVCDNTHTRTKIDSTVMAGSLDFDLIFIEKYSVPRMWSNQEKLLSHRNDDDNGETQTDLRKKLCLLVELQSVWLCVCSEHFFFSLSISFQHFQWINIAQVTSHHINIPHTVSYCID